MKPTELLKQAIDFNQTTFQNAYDAGVLFQDQVERMATSMLDQATWMPDEGRKAIDTYVDAYKSGREQLKLYVDDSFKRAEEILVK